MKPCQFARAFFLGRLYEKRRPITTAAVRALGVSPATAKRDLRKVRELARDQLPERRHVQRCAHCGGHSVAAITDTSGG